MAKRNTIEYTCDICGENAGSTNYYKSILEYVDYKTYSRVIRFEDSEAYELHMCNKCSNIVGKFIDVLDELTR